MFEPPAGTVGRTLVVEPLETADGKQHGLTLALDSASTPQKPLWFGFGAKGLGLFKNERDDTYFKVSLDGHLDKAIFGRIKLDDSGERIPGSGVTEVQDIESPRINELFQKEADFWLKNMYRKKSAPKTVPEKAAPSPK